MGVASGLYYFNNLDAYDHYGFAVKSGSNDLLKDNDATYLVNEWADGKGKEYYTGIPPVMQSREFTLTGHILANSFADFNNKYNALKARFRQAGTIEIYNTETEIRVNTVYLKMNNLNRKTRLKGGKKIAVEISITFGEVM